MVEYCVYWLENGEPMHEVFSSLAAAEMYSCAIRGKENIEWVEAYDCLTVDFAKEQNAGFIVRGIRTVHDFEYEETIADINRKLAGIETILLFTEPELTSISSTIVRELLQFGKDVTPFLPEGMKID